MKDWGGVAATFVDGVGVGAGVVDRMQMLGHAVIEVNGGELAFEEDKFYNKNAECWYRMREWIKGADLPPKDSEMRLALIGREYVFDTKERIQLERKKDMKKRGLQSPDEADALCYTFAEELGDLVRNSVEPEDENSVEPN
jgi:phage terminase large subunit